MTLTDFAPSLERRGAWWTAPLAALHDAWTRYQVYERTYAELSALSNRELTDLGICRSSIPHIADEAAYGKAG